MSISRVEQEIQNIKKDFSAIEPVKTSKAEQPEKKGSRSMMLAAVIVVIVAVVVLLVIVLL
jgi:heme/copper-type cytochrome/quinol oxidase subunit 2